MSVLPLDQQLCFSFYAASMAITRVYKPMLDRLGLTYPQYLVLHVLWEEDGRTVGRIADRLSLEPSTITPLVKRLELAGLVTRGRDPEDDRRVRVLLTDAGRSIRQACACLGEALFARSGMDLEQLAALHAQVREFNTALTAEAATVDAPSAASNSDAAAG